MKTIQDQTNNYVINQKFKSNAFDDLMTDLDLLAFQYQNDTMSV